MISSSYDERPTITVGVFGFEGRSLLAGGAVDEIADHAEASRPGPDQASERGEHEESNMKKVEGEEEMRG
jgi:hypothetical protein